MLSEEKRDFERKKFKQYGIEMLVRRIYITKDKLKAMLLMRKNDLLFKTVLLHEKNRNIETPVIYF